MDSLFRSAFPRDPIPRRNERDAHSIAAFYTKRLAFAPDGRTAIPGLQSPTLVPSAEGRIDCMLLTIPTYALEDTDYRAAYESLFAALPKSTKLVVAVNEQASSDVRTLLNDQGHSTHVKIVPIDDLILFSVWAEDAFVVCHDGQDGTQYLVEPMQFLRYGDTLIAESVAENSNVRVAQAPLIFQGGNCLIGDDFWLMGSDYVTDTLELFEKAWAPVNIQNPTAQDVIGTFGKFVDTKRRLIPIGTNKPLALAPQANKEGGRFYIDHVSGVGGGQPIFHIDMFITLVGRNPAGKFEILVGSPQLGVDEAGHAAPANIAMQAAFDDIASQLDAREDFEIDRLPLPLVSRESKESLPLGDRERWVASLDPGSRDRKIYEVVVQELKMLGAQAGDAVTLRDFYFATYNNCLVQSVPNARCVYYPTYGYSNTNRHGDFAWMSILDTWVKDFWCNRSYEPNPLTDFHPFAVNLGALHCITKYLARS